MKERKYRLQRHSASGVLDGFTKRPESRKTILQCFFLTDSDFLKQIMDAADVMPGVDLSMKDSTGNRFVITAIDILPEEPEFTVTLGYREAVTLMEILGRRVLGDRLHSPNGHVFSIYRKLKALEVPHVKNLGAHGGIEFLGRIDEDAYFDSDEFSGFSL